jgi:hypothetical protein
MDLVLVILLEIISYEGPSVSQCMQRLTTPDGTGGAFGARSLAYVFANPAELNARDDARGGGL